MTYTHFELGALFVAVGEQMMKNDLCAAAACDEHGRLQIIRSLVEQGIPLTRAQRLAKLSLRTAAGIINLNEADR